MTDGFMADGSIADGLMADCRQHAAGFTLLEVLVALAILAIAFGFAFEAIGGGVGWLRGAQGEQEAVRLAETMLARLGHDIPVQPGHASGRQGRFDWTLDIDAALADPPPAGNLAAYPVAVRVGGVRLRSVRLGSK